MAVPYLIRASESSFATQEMLAEARSRRVQSSTHSERIAETIVGAGFVIAAVAVAVLLPGDRALDPVAFALVVVSVYLASLVHFEVGSCFTMPLQLALVPALFVLPPELVPVSVAAGLLLGRVHAALRRGAAWSRVPHALGDSWFSIGPAVVVGLCGSPAAGSVPANVLVGALVAQFAVDALAGAARERLHGGAALSEQVVEDGWVYLVDLSISPVAYGLAIAAAAHLWVLALIWPLFGLLYMFSRERERRIASTIELSEAYRGTARALGDVVEHDDAYTGFHSRSVVSLATAIAAELNLDLARQRNCELGALLHDVGKVTIPKAIINKAGPLNDEEWAVIKTHTIEGQRILDEVGGLMCSIGTIVRSAHERWDGDGYPDGLAGEAIPIESRIIFCSDAFNAMTTDRSYRAARSQDAAIAELIENSGTQFDPAVVKALIQVVQPAGTEPTAGSVLVPELTMNA